MALKGLSVDEAVFNRVKELADQKKSSVKAITTALFTYAFNEIDRGAMILEVEPMKKHQPKPEKQPTSENGN